MGVTGHLAPCNALIDGGLGTLELDAALSGPRWMRSRLAAKLFKLRAYEGILLRAGLIDEEGHGAFFLKNRFCCLNAEVVLQDVRPACALTEFLASQSATVREESAFSGEIERGSGRHCRFDSRFLGSICRARVARRVYFGYVSACRNRGHCFLATRVRSMRLLLPALHSFWASRWHVGRASHSLRPILAARLSVLPNCAPPIASMLLPLPISR